MVSSTIVSPELMRSTGGWALSNQPHCVVSSVAGSMCIRLPLGSLTTRSAGSGGPGVGAGMVACSPGGGGCVCASAPAASRAAPVAPANSSFTNPECGMFGPSPRCRPSLSSQQWAILGTWATAAQWFCGERRKMHNCNAAGPANCQPPRRGRSVARKPVAQLGRPDQHEDVVLDPPLGDRLERGRHLLIQREALG